MYNTSEMRMINQNFLDSCEKSHLVTLDEIHKTNIIVRMIRAVLNLMIPLV